MAAAKSMTAIVALLLLGLALSAEAANSDRKLLQGNGDCNQFVRGSGNTAQGGLINVAALNGNNINLLTKCCGSNSIKCCANDVKTAGNKCSLAQGGLLAHFPIVAGVANVLAVTQVGCLVGTATVPITIGCTV